MGLFDVPPLAICKESVREIFGLKRLPVGRNAVLRTPVSAGDGLGGNQNAFQKAGGIPHFGQSCSNRIALFQPREQAITGVQDSLPFQMQAPLGLVLPTRLWR